MQQKTKPIYVIFIASQFGRQVYKTSKLNSSDTKKLERLSTNIWTPIVWAREMCINFSSAPLRNTSHLNAMSVSTSLTQWSQIPVRSGYWSLIATTLTNGRSTDESTPIQTKHIGTYHLCLTTTTDNHCSPHKKANPSPKSTTTGNLTGGTMVCSSTIKALHHNTRHFSRH